MLLFEIGFSSSAVMRHLLKSLLTDGKDSWFKAVDQNASNSVKRTLMKQGGEMLPKVENLSAVRKTK